MLTQPLFLYFYSNLQFHNVKHFEETRALLDKSHFIYIIATAMDGNYSYLNSHYRQKFPHYDDLIGQPYHITMHPDDMQVCTEVAAKCFANPDKMFPATIRKHDGKGGFVFTQWEYKAMFTPEGEPAGIFCIGYDITTYEIEKQLRRQRDVEIGDKKKVLQEIAFQQSHLVRAPLSNIIGLAQVLSQTDGDQNTINLCQLILASAHQLDNIVKDIGGLAYGDTAAKES